MKPIFLVPVLLGLAAMNGPALGDTSDDDNSAPPATAPFTDYRTQAPRRPHPQ